MAEPQQKPWEKFAQAKPPSGDGPWNKFGAAKSATPPKASTPAAAPPQGAIDKLPLSPVDKEGLKGFSSSFGVDNPQGVTDVLKQFKNNMGKAVGQSYMKWLNGLDKETPGGAPKSFLDPFMYINPTLATAMTPFDLAASGIEGISKTIQEAGGKTVHGLAHGDNKEAAHGMGELTGSIIQLGLGKKASELENTRLGKAASEVHGAVKTAATMGGDATEAQRVAHRASSGWLGRMIRNRQVQAQYVDAKGLQVGEQIDRAAKGVEKDIEATADHINEQLRDKGAGSSTVDVSREAQLIQDLYNKTVKTGEGVHPAIKEVYDQAKGAKTGLWDFDKARQLRSALGRSLGRIQGPQQKVGWQIYNDLSNKLTGVAKKAGLGDEWNHYNKNSRVFHQWYKSIIDDATEATSGEQVGNALKRHKGETTRLLDNLSKFGLDKQDVQNYMKFHERWSRQSSSGGRGTLFRLAYGSPGGMATMVAARTAGAGWLPSVAAGAAGGYAWNELVNAVRAARLSPDVLEHIANTTSLERPLKLNKTTKPAAPPAPTPSPAPSAAPSPPAETAKPKPAALPAPKPAEVKVEEAKPSSVAKPEVKKVPEGEHGTGKLARQAKARERVAKIREEKGATGAGGGGQEVSGGGAAEQARDIKEAQAAQKRVQTSKMDVNELQIPEMEEFMKAKMPKAWKDLQEARRSKAFPDKDYQDALKWYILAGLEDQEPE